MSELITTEAIVLSKLNYSDTSKISSLFTKELGKIPVIIKGGRSATTKIGKVVDPLNHILVVVYNRQSREIQILGSADLLHHYSNLKEKFDSLKYAYAVLELVNQLMVEHEINIRVFNGVKKILDRFENNVEFPGLIFTRFCLFFIEELGFALDPNICTLCSGELTGQSAFLSHEHGFLCSACSSKTGQGNEISMELFTYFQCLKSGKMFVTNNGNVQFIISFFERYLSFHISSYKKLTSLTL